MPASETIQRLYPQDLKAGHEFILSAVANDLDLLKYVSKNLRTDRKFILNLVEKNGCALEFV